MPALTAGAGILLCFSTLYLCFIYLAMQYYIAVERYIEAENCLEELKQKYESTQSDWRTSK